MKRLLSLFLLLAIALPLGATTASQGENYYDFTPAAAGIYEKVMSLQLEAAQEDIVSFRDRDPTNLVTYHLESYVDFFLLYLTGDERLDNELEVRFDNRIEALEQGDENSPFFRYALAEARLHRSLIHLRFERQLSAFRELNKANKLLRDNAKRHPNFLLTYKDLGLLHAAVGSIPSQYKWGVELFSSLNGTIAEGREEMELARTAKDSPFQLETEVLYAYLELHLAGKPASAWKQMNSLGLQPESKIGRAHV